MCGIAGWYSRRGIEVDRGVISAQCKAILRRGPDDEGILTDGDFGFGMRRLSIIDLAGGHQPMTTRDGAYSIVFNGEIYNYRALRAALESRGRQFRTNSDTEVILEGFAEWGDLVWPKLEGMFAVAIWDHGSRTLHLARDPLGIKPLFYSIQNGGLAFGSEMKTLFPVPGLSFTPDASAVDSYFGFGHVLAEGTIYQEIKKVEPGCWMSFGADAVIRIERYWRLEFHTNRTLSEEEWISGFRSQFLSTVERHLVSDVPLGAFLSGGIDSSAVVAAMAQVTTEPVQTFTIGFSDPRYDESRYAARIAEHLGCRHQCRVIEVESASTILPILASCFDEPFADSSAIPTWYVSRLAAERVKVALSGDGGDELFAGYTRHKSEKMIAYFKGLPRPIQALGGLVHCLPLLPFDRWNYSRQRLRKWYADARLPTTYSRFVSKNQISSVAFREAVYGAAFRDQLKAARDRAQEVDPMISAVSDDPIEQFLYADTVIRLPNTMLTKVDRTSMYHSLEVRVPFLSHVFVDWAATMPISLKLRGFTSKYIVRKVIEPWLPKGILNRPKQGFSIPLAKWFKGDLGRYAEQLWRESGLASTEYFERTSHRQLVQGA